MSQHGDAVLHDLQVLALLTALHCLVDEDGASHYGGVREWRLRDGQLEIELTPQAAEVLQTDGFVLSLDGSDAGVVQAGLASLLS